MSCLDAFQFLANVILNICLDGLNYIQGPDLAFFWLLSGLETNRIPALECMQGNEGSEKTTLMDSTINRVQH